MPNYEKGKIYKLTSEQTDKIYIGSTINKLSKRLYNHKKNPTSSKEIIKYDDCKIELIEDFPCENKKELEAREYELINKNREKCVNFCDRRSKSVEWNKEYHHNYHIKHQEKKNKYAKEYRDKNKQEILIKKKDYYLRTRKYCSVCKKYVAGTKAKWKLHINGRNHLLKKEDL